MKTIETYQCETCKEIHQSADSATSCEKTHIDFEDLVLTDVVYEYCIHGFPEKIVLKAITGEHRATYRLQYTGRGPDPLFP